MSYGYSITWHPTPDSTCRVASSGHATVVGAYDAAVLMAVQSYWQPRKWYEYWRWKESWPVRPKWDSLKP